MKGLRKKTKRRDGAWRNQQTCDDFKDAKPTNHRKRTPARQKGEVHYQPWFAVEKTEWGASTTLLVGIYPDFARFARFFGRLKRAVTILAVFGE